MFAKALHEGPQKLFYFILGHYVERNLQYGLVHTDLTPRPAYVAFAAVGRLLNGAKPVGRLNLGDDKLMAYVFNTHVDGDERETLVTWSETTPTTVKFRPFEKAYDYLGREISSAQKIELSRPPIFLVGPPGWSKGMKIESPPAKSKWLDGQACPVVLQLIGKGDEKQSAFQLDDSRQLRLIAYNFGDKTAQGNLEILGAKCTETQIEIVPGGREELTLTVDGERNVTAKLDLASVGHAIVSANVSTTDKTKPK